MQIAEDQQRIDKRPRKGPKPALDCPALRKRTLAAIAAGLPLRQLKANGFPDVDVVRYYAALNPEFRLALGEAMGTGEALFKAKIEAELEAAYAAIRRGVRPKHLAEHGLMDVSRLNYYRKSSDTVEACVRAALEAAGNGPRAPFSERSVRLIKALEGGSSLREACDIAHISSTDLRRRRAADPELDRKICALLPDRSFDDVAKAFVIKAIGRGETIKSALAGAGGYSASVYNDHLKKDPEFARRVREALGGYDDPVIRGRPCLARAKFDEILDLIPRVSSVSEACEIVGVKPASFFDLTHDSPQRVAAYHAALARTDRANYGVRRFRNGKTEADFDALLDLVRDGLFLAEAQLRVGLGDSVVRSRRRRDPAFEARLANAGHRPNVDGRSMLDAAERRAAVLDAIRSGVPIYALGLRGLPSQFSVRPYAARNPDFAAQLVEAAKEGAPKRRLHTNARLAAALAAIAGGIKPVDLRSHGHPGPEVLRHYRRVQPGFEERYQSAVSQARGDAAPAVALSTDQIVDLVTKRLPKWLKADERQTCINQAWLDAMMGDLTADKISPAIQRYLTEVRPVDRNRNVHIDQNGDMRSSKHGG